MGRHGKRQIRECTYCGKQRPITRDHVVPKCLFPGPVPNDMPIVPACQPCNQELAQHQDYLRDMLICDFRCSDHPAARAILEGPVRRAIQTNRSLVARTVRDGIRKESLYTLGGIYLGDGYVIPTEQPRLNHIFRMMVRGLYYSKFGRRLPEDYAVSVKYQDVKRPLALREAWNTLMSLPGYNGPFQWGDGVFTCLFLQALEDPALTAWLLVFYGGFGVLVHTSPPTKKRLSWIASLNCSVAHRSSIAIWTHKYRKIFMVEVRGT